MPRTTIEHWQTLAEIVDAGGFAAAAERLGRSQSSVSYAVAQLQERLGVALLEMDGRRARLTPVGRVLLAEARPLIADLERLEARARRLAAGDEPEVRLAVDSIFPRPRLFAALAAFRAAFPATRVHITEAAPLMVPEALAGPEPADLVLAAHPVGAWASVPVVEISFVAVAAAGHPLAAGDHPVTLADLARHLVVVIRSPETMDVDAALARRSGEHWSVNSLEAALSAIASGLGYGWLPRDLVAAPLAAGTLRELPLATGRTRQAVLNLIIRDADGAGPATRALAGHLTHPPGSAPSG
ncbi:LysR family transcriptional regulator [Segnochrobactraceae bacterium EtOH-i3]